MVDPRIAGKLMGYMPSYPNSHLMGLKAMTSSLTSLSVETIIVSENVDETDEVG